MGIRLIKRTPDNRTYTSQDNIITHAIFYIFVRWAIRYPPLRLQAHERRHWPLREPSSLLVLLLLLQSSVPVRHVPHLSPEPEEQDQDDRGRTAKQQQLVSKFQVFDANNLKKEKRVTIRCLSTSTDCRFRFNPFKSFS
jgi:hypothetical protein